MMGGGGTVGSNLALAALAHELRTPITTILGYGELIGHAGGGAETARYAEALLEAARTLDATLGAMLDLIQIERGNLALAEDDVDIGRELLAAARLLHGAGAARGIRILTEVEGDLPVALGDARMLRQVFLNLIGNALKYGASDSSVLLRARRMPDGGLAVTVSDKGAGMRTEEIRRAFIPFNRLGRNATDAQQGSGIGLPLCKAIAELHDGHVVLRSDVGVGTTATLILPPERIGGRTNHLQPTFAFAEQPELCG